MMARGKASVELEQKLSGEPDFESQRAGKGEELKCVFSGGFLMNNVS